MKKILSFILIFCILFCFGGCSSVQNENLFAMNTLMTFSISGKNSKECYNEIKDQIQSLESLLSVTDEKSEISRINKSESAIAISEDTAAIIRQSIEISKLTEGYFDITVYPLVKLWGFTQSEQSVPTAEQIESALKLIDYNKIKINQNDIEFSGMLDTGAVAKGYACDKIKTLLEKHSIQDAIISLGGNILLKGPEKTVGIQHPLKSDEIICTLKAKDTSVVTSGGYQRYFEKDGQRYHHIIDTKTGYPANSGIISATIICQNSTLADGLSTATYIMGKQKAIELWKKNRYFDMILITENEIYSTLEIEVTDSDFKLNIVE